MVCSFDVAEMDNSLGGDGTLDVFGIKLLNNRAVMPTRGTADAAGCDLYSVEDVIIPPGSRTLVGTGLAMQFPKNTLDIYFHAVDFRPSLK